MKIVATVSYGGTAAEYAPVVHETHRTNSKFLERPAREVAKHFLSKARRAVRRETT